MTLPIGCTVVITENVVHPRLAGRLGTVVSVTPVQKVCGLSHVTNHTRNDRKPREKVRCGGNPILNVEGIGRVLLPAACVTVVDEAAA